MISPEIGSYNAVPPDERSVATLLPFNEFKRIWIPDSLICVFWVFIVTVPSEARLKKPLSRATFLTFNLTAWNKAVFSVKEVPPDNPGLNQLNDVTNGFKSLGERILFCLKSCSPNL